MAEKSETKKEEKKLTKLTVAAPGGRRFRAGLEFGPEAREVEVSPAQAAAIMADPLLKSKE